MSIRFSSNTEAAFGGSNFCNIDQSRFVEATEATMARLVLSESIGSALRSLDLTVANTFEALEAALAPLTSALIADHRLGRPTIPWYEIHDTLALEGEQAQWADTILDQAFDECQASFPVLLTFANSAKVRVLSGLSHLSYQAGLEGDDEADWNAEASDALVDAFGLKEGANWVWFETALAALHRAFEGGVAQRSINNAASVAPSRSLALAKAYAVIYLDECEFPEDKAPCAIEREVGRIAYKIASRHPVTPAEAALATMQAYRDAGMKLSLTIASQALNRARVGDRERREWEDEVRERELGVESQINSIFSGMGIQ